MVVEGAADQQGLVAIRKAEGSASPVDEPFKSLGCGRGIVEGVEEISGPVGVVGIGYETLDAFKADLLLHLRNVENNYAELFEDYTTLAGASGNLVFTGTEDDPEFSYHNGNEEPRGFGHIGFAVPDLEAASARFEALGVSFVKRPQDGKMHNIAFIRDPDGYWIEIFAPGGMA